MSPAPQNQTGNDFAQLDIFTILGIAQDDQDRDAFRAEVEDAIWEEIMDNEVADKLSDADIDKVDQILSDDAIDSDHKRSSMFGMLAEKLPNMEEVVKQYTTTAKVDLLSARLEGLQEYFQNRGDQTKLEQVKKAAELFTQGEYTVAVQSLNEITA